MTGDADEPSADQPARESSGRESPVREPSARESLARESSGRESSTRGAKAARAYRTISEVSAEIGVPAHILRFWETRFPQLKPLQRGGNRRYYRPSDIAFAACLHELLHKRGMTVKGAQMLVAEHGAERLPALLGEDRIAALPGGEGDPAPGAPTPADMAPTAPAAMAAAMPAELVESLRRLRARLAQALSV